MAKKKAARKKTAKKTVEDKILERLDLLLRVLSLQVGVGKSVTERARLLKIAGLDNRTIAEVLNTTPATVRAVTSNLRRRLGAGRATEEDEL